MDEMLDNLFAQLQEDCSRIHLYAPISDILREQGKDVEADFYLWLLALGKYPNCTTSQGGTKYFDWWSDSFEKHCILPFEKKMYMTDWYNRFSDIRDSLGEPCKYWRESLTEEQRKEAMELAQRGECINLEV